jgi:hypothetical protein
MKHCSRLVILMHDHKHVYTLNWYKDECLLLKLFWDYFEYELMVCFFVTDVMGGGNRAIEL